MLEILSFLIKLEKKNNINLLCWVTYSTMSISDRGLPGTMAGSSMNGSQKLTSFIFRERCLATLKKKLNAKMSLQCFRGGFHVFFLMFEVKLINQEFQLNQLSPVFFGNVYLRSDVKIKIGNSQPKRSDLTKNKH